MTTTVETLEDLGPLVGTDLGSSSWIQITQEMVNEFARATGDEQWIHVDPVRAAEGPFGTTIAHGFMTLSLIAPMFTEILQIRKVSRTVNYGLNKVRFTAPVPVGSRVRAVTTLASVDAVTGGAQLTVDAVFEREGADKPVVIAQHVFRYYA